VLNQISTTPWGRIGECSYMSTILDLSARWRWVVKFTPRPLHPPPSKERAPVPTGKEVGWAPVPVWTLWSREKSYHCRESNPGRPSPSPSLYRLNYPSSLCCIIPHNLFRNVYSLICYKLTHSFSRVIFLGHYLTSKSIFSLYFSDRVTWGW
jgi:hypothetical protein